MQTRVDNFLKMAFEAIEKVDIDGKTFYKSKNPDVLIKEYKGYISSLGANIVQAGVRAAITFYEAEEKGTAGDRRLVNAAIKYILTSPSEPVKKYSDCKLTQILPKEEDQLQQKALEIIDAATALKLALRTYKLK